MENNPITPSNGAQTETPVNHFEYHISEKAIQSLRETRPWISFMGIVGFIMSGFILLASFLFLFAASNMPAYTRGGEAPFGFAFVLYLIIAVVSFFPALYLYNYGQNLKNYLAAGTPEALDEAMEMQKRYFKFIGILSIIYLAFLAIVLLIALIGFFAAAIH